MSRRRHKKLKRELTPERLPYPLVEAIDRAKEALESGQPQQAIDLLEPLTEKYSRAASLFAFLGDAYLDTGDLYSAAINIKRAVKLRPDPIMYLPLCGIYLELEMTGLALDAFRRVRKVRLDPDETKDVLTAIEELEQEITNLARLMGLKLRQTEQVLQLLNEGQLALQSGDYLGSLNLNRRATRIAGPWPPLLNNMSIAYFFSGNWTEAISTAEQVLSADPDNIHALGNLIRFLAWTGEVDRARHLWEHLETLPPVDRTTLSKKIEAAAALDEHEAVYLLVKTRIREYPKLRLSEREKLYLAAAEANTGRPDAAERLSDLEKTTPWAGEMLTALKAGKPGPGWATSYPYISPVELLPYKELEAFTELLSREGHMPEVKFRREVDRYAARFPQMVLFAQKSILEMKQFEAGVSILATLATPQAFEALRAFALGQLGTDEARTKALLALQEAGQIQAGEMVRIWREGKWQDVELRSYEIGGQRELSYRPEVVNLIYEGTLALTEGKEQTAERIFRRALRLEPQAAEAYSNLGVIYNRREQPEKACQMYRKAIEIDPSYVFPRCNLALNLIDQDELEEAEELIQPVTELTRLNQQEAAHLAYAQAKLHVAYKEYEAAMNALDLSLQIMPDFEPALDLREQLEGIQSVFKHFQNFFEKNRERQLARRRKLQKRLNNPAPILREVLELYTKDQLTGIARQVIPTGGWSSLRKAPLIERIAESLTDIDTLAAIIQNMTPTEISALERLIEKSGYLSWDKFDQEFGNDLEEHPNWNWHPPESVMGRLRSLAVIAESHVDGVLSVCLPFELREPIRELLEQVKDD